MIEDDNRLGGEMGVPIKITLKGQSVFLCCKSCLGKQPSTDKWQTLTANLRSAQATCPVTGAALPKDAPSVVINNRLIFVSSKDGIATVKSDPAKYIAKVDELLEKNLKVPQDKKM